MQGLSPRAQLHALVDAMAHAAQQHLHQHLQHQATHGGTAARKPRAAPAPARCRAQAVQGHWAPQHACQHQQEPQLCDDQPGRQRRQLLLGGAALLAGSLWCTPQQADAEVYDAVAVEGADETITNLVRANMPRRLQGVEPSGCVLGVRTAGRSRSGGHGGACRAPVQRCALQVYLDIAVAPRSYKTAGERTLGDKSIIPLDDAAPLGRIVLGAALAGVAGWGWGAATQGEELCSTTHRWGVARRAVRQRGAGHRGQLLGAGAQQRPQRHCLFARAAGRVHPGAWAHAAGRVGGDEGEALRWRVRCLCHWCPCMPWRSMVGCCRRASRARIGWGRWRWTAWSCR